MSICRRVSLTLFTVACLAGEDLYVVPERAQPVVLSFPAVVDLERGSAVMLMPTSRELVAQSVVLPGTRVEIGDPVITFAAEISRKRATVARLALVEAEREARRRELELEREHQALLSEQAGLEQELLVAEAELTAAHAVDGQQLQVLAAEVALADAELAAARRALALAQVRAQAGTLEVDALRAVQRTVDRAVDALTVAQLEHQRAATAAQALTVQRRAARVASLRAKLGLRDDGTPDPAAGIRGRIAAQQTSQQRERRQAKDKHDEAERELHLHERDGWDHTPVQSLVLSGASQRKIFFAPAELPNPAMAERVGDEPFTLARGWGWSVGKPLIITRPGRPGLALVRGQAVWSALVPDGLYTITVTVGDAVDWDGAMIQLVGGGAPQGCFAARRLEPRQTVTASGSITVRGGRLDVVFGGLEAKALRAPVAGIAMPREWIIPGWKPGWMQDPAAFVVGPEAVRLRARVHQTLAPLLMTPSASSAVTGSDPLATLRTNLAVSEVSFTSPGGVQGRAKVAAISTRPEPLSLRSDDQPRSTLDRIGNEVLFTPVLADAARVRLGEQVTISVVLTLPPESTVLPAHLVTALNDRSHIQPAGGALQAVMALRVADHWIVAKSIPAGTRLVPPQVTADARGPRSVPGEVVAGIAVPVMAANTAGRLASLIAEGSEVKAGQMVATLYNPWMEERREESERKRAKANDSFRNAAEARRVAAQRAAAAQREQAAAEQLAYIDLGLARLDQPLPLLRASQTLASARQAVADTTSTLARAEAQAASDPQRLAAARSAASIATLAARRAELEMVATQRRVDWFAIRSAEWTWHDAAAEVAGREADLHLARVEEQVSALQAELRLQQAMQGSRWERNFLAGREILAPAAGRLFYRNGRDDRTGQSGKFEQDFWIWHGMTLADILDMDHLAFAAEVPEDAFARMQVGAAVELVFAQFNHRRISGTIRELGQALLTARDRDDQADASTPVARLRLIPVSIDFTPPADLRQRLVPGTKGVLVLP